MYIHSAVLALSQVPKERPSGPSDDMLYVTCDIAPLRLNKHAYIYVRRTAPMQLCIASSTVQDAHFECCISWVPRRRREGRV